jgi:hypothetical protein
MALMAHKVSKACKGQPVCRVSLAPLGQTEQTVKTGRQAHKGLKAILAHKVMRLYMQTSLPHK